MRLYTLQLLRFFASLSVLLFHLNLVRSGYKGVDVFFVISGFVMYYTLFCKPRPKALKFAVNRFTKIYFLYWLALVLLFCVQPFQLKAFLLGTVMLIPGHNSVLGVSWSLSYELYFYFLIGAIVYFLSENLHKVIFLLLLFISTVITFCNLTPYSVKGSLLNFFVGPNLWEFLLGIGCASFVTSHHKRIGSATALYSSVLGLLTICFLTIPYNTPVSYVAYGSLSTFVVFFCVAYEKRGIVGQRFGRTVSILGDASYAIYLFGPIVTILVGTDSNLLKMMIIAITIGFSIFINQFIENKLLKWGRELILEKPTTPNKVFQKQDNRNTNRPKNKM